MSLNNIRLTPKILLVMVLMVALVAVVSIAAEMGMARLNRSMSVAQDAASGMVLAQRANFMQVAWIRDIEFATKDLDPETRAQVLADADIKYANLVGFVEELEDLVQNPEALEEVARARDIIAEYRRIEQEVGRLLAAGNRAGAEALVVEAAPRAFDLWIAFGNIEVLKDQDITAAAEESGATYRQARTAIIAVAGTGAAAGLGLAVWIVLLGIARPLVRLTRAVNRVAEGDYQAEVPALDRRDEIGELAQALEAFKRNGLERQRLEAEHARHVQQQLAEAERRRELNALADRFAEELRGIAQSMSAAAAQFQGNAQDLAAIAEETGRQSNAAALAADHAAANVHTVAAAAEELTSSIAEIGRQVNDSARVARAAVEELEGTNSTVEGLSRAAQEIGEVTRLIADIAEQTNLLALNATIEAARAGAVGKGFAVVATEVKSLASQTAQATEKIATQVSAIQETSGRTVAAIQRIGTTIRRIDEITTTIAAAVEEQSAATQEIARNVQEAATGTQTVSENVNSVTRAAEETGKAATQVLTAASRLAEEAGHLQREVDAYMAQVKGG